MHLLLPMRRLQHAQKVVDKLLAIILDVFLRVLPNQQHLTHMAFALDMTIIN